MRYIGAFSFGVVAFLSLFFFFNGKKEAAVALAVAFTLLCATAAIYLSINLYLSGHITGFDRLAAERETFADFIQMFSEGLLNELLIIRKFRDQGDLLFAATSCVQAIVIITVIALLRRHYSFWEQLKNNSFSCICISISILYLISILILRSISHFDNLDYRLLAPFSSLVILGIVNMIISLPDIYKSTTCAKLIIFGFFLLSLLLNLPKQYLLEQFMH
ncbi:hypothetical protein [Pontibacter harenae]|uniref:hypothetical protein n=1 Tax=Pontibacter harenae TaxID=2894083 RepID=UPI001E4C600F|nr:hypothetical protein [Pontibacter harenae]MCC9167334.1 hypothetical protein [Pontibacter harenae]